ncbi:MAG: hydroxylamine reductase [Spirochaetales bacterium]|nr:hydroxylamine reductase [Spirochaetales bacterium]
MSMFCYQCQETAGDEGCTIRGVCGKDEDTARLQDLLLHALKGVGILATELRAAGLGVSLREADDAVMEGLFATITNANFDAAWFEAEIAKDLRLRDSLRDRLSRARSGAAPASTAASACSGSDDPACRDAALWTAVPQDYLSKAALIGVLATKDEDIRSLRELLVYGLKGMAAYAHHAAVLGERDPEVFAFMARALAATTDDSLSADDLTALVLECGKVGVAAMASLDAANTGAYGKPRATTVQLGVRGNPGILISGHDLKDLEMLLEQTAGTGVDVYSHGEMLPAHYYPAFSKYPHFAGNYGNAWWRQKEEFEAFRGPILMTTNCVVPPAASYRERLFTTGVVGVPGCAHIAPDAEGHKDFSAVIALAKQCPPPTELESGTLVGGFAHDQVAELAPKVIEAVKSGAIRKFVVMAGCDGRQKGREYYTGFAEALPDDAVVLTAGCAKYRYNKLELGDIGGIPRVLDAGQCNDSYSLALTALALKDAFGLADVNELPLAFNLAWYEQKAVLVLLSLLYLGFRNIRVGPTLPAFLSPGVAKVLVDKFGLGAPTDVATDLAELVG